MKVKYSILIFLTLGFVSCTFFQEIYEPKDLLLQVQSLRDYKAPTTLIAEPTNGQEVATSYQIIGTAVDNGVKAEIAGINCVYINIDGGGYAAREVNSGSWQTVFSNCTEGWHTNAYYAVDLNGNTSATNRLAVFVQTSMPSLTVTTPINSILTNSSTLLFSGNADVGKPYQIDNVYIENVNNSEKTETLYSQKTKNWRWQMNISEGTNNFFVRTVADSGKTNSLSWRVILDKRAPTVVVNTPANGEKVGAQYTLSGTIADNLSGLESVLLQIDANAATPLVVNNGAFSKTINLPANLGIHTNAIIVRDKAHNCATNIMLVVRAAIPVITCNYASGFATNQAAVSLSGKAFIDAPYTIDTLKVKTNNVTLYMTDELSDSNWGCGYTMTRFSNNIQVFAFGNNAEVTVLPNLIMYYDTTAPTLTVNATPSYTNASTVAVSGTAGDNLCVSKVYVRRVGDAWTLATGTTNWSSGLSLSAGINTLQVYAVDSAGNATTNSRSVSVETTAPTLTVNATPSYTNKTTVTVSGTAGDASGIAAVYVRVNGGGWAAAMGTTSWNKSVSLSASVNTLQVYAVDSAGNTTTNSRSVTVETTAPTLAVNALMAYTKEVSVTVSGTASDSSGISGVYMRVNGGGWAAATGSTNWNKTVSLSAGINTIQIYAVDSAGNCSSTNSRSVTRDTVIPSVTITKPSGTITISSNTFRVEGTASDVSGIAAVYVSVNGGGWAAATGSTSWNTSVSLSSGTNTVSVYAVDSAGNVSDIMDRAIQYIPQYTVTFDSQGGSAVAGTNVLTNTFVNAPASPTKSGYGFCGWYADADFKTLWRFSTNRVVCAITLYASWLANADYVDNGTTITYKRYSGSSINVVLPETVNGDLVAAVGTNAFKNKSTVKSIVLPTGLTTIQSNAFKGCSGLTNIVLPTGVTTIDQQAFYGCSGLKSIVLPSALTTIGQQTFSGCSGLTNIALPTSLTAIGQQAFYGCSGLKNIALPTGVTSIKNGAFNACSGLTNIVLPSGLTTIEGNAFQGCSGLKNIALPTGVTSIGSSAFNSCSGLTNIALPSGVTTIGNSAFYGCSGLKNITLPSGLTSISDYAFRGCSGLTNIALPSGVTSIGSSAFYNCTGLKNIVLPSGLTSISDSAFENCSGLTNIVLPTGLTTIGYGVFQYCSGLKSIVLPSGLTSIDFLVFYHCSGLKSIALPSGVTSIGMYAFYGCSGLTNIALPSGLTTIENDAFSSCSGLTSIALPSGVTSISDGAFRGCSGLTNITLPSGLTTIEDGAFNCCTGLKNLTVQATTPPTLGDYALDNTPAALKIYVPAGSTNAYKMASGWSSYAGVITAIP